MFSNEFYFGEDMFRDNEQERARVQDVLDRINAGDELEDLASSEIETIIAAGKCEDSNAAVKLLGRRGLDYLESNAEEN